MFDSHWLSTFASVPSWSPCTLGCCSEELAGIQRTDSAVSLPLENICCACLYVCECMHACVYAYLGMCVEVWDNFIKSVLSFHLHSGSEDQLQVIRLVWQILLPTTPFCCATITYFWYILVCINMRPRLYALCPHPYLCVNTLLLEIPAPYPWVITCVSSSRLVLRYVLKCYSGCLCKGNIIQN